MNDMQARLAKCFAAVFPELPEHEIRAASPRTVESWDSLASVTLISVLEEEFHMEIPPEDADQLVSFELVLDYLQNGKGVS